MNCPLCKRQVYQSIKTKSLVGEEARTAQWMFCSCGCVFNTENEPFTEKDREEYNKMKSLKEREEYYIYTYGNLIEEMTYGRKALDVGFKNDIAIKQLRERGWLATGIDLLPNNYIMGDFLTYKFKEKFDFIKMTDYLQTVDPLKAIKKAYTLLYPEGVILISTPNTDLIKENTFPNWGRWDTKGVKQYYNRCIIKDILLKANKDLSGKLVLKLFRNDISRRYPSWNNMHIIVKKEERQEERQEEKIERK